MRLTDRFAVSRVAGAGASSARGAAPSLSIEAGCKARSFGLPDPATAAGVAPEAPSAMPSPAGFSAPAEVLLPESVDGEMAAEAGLDALLGEPERGYRLRVERLRRAEPRGQDELMLSVLARRQLGRQAVQAGDAARAPVLVPRDAGGLGREDAERGQRRGGPELRGELDRGRRDEAVRERRGGAAREAGSPGGDLFLKQTTRASLPISAKSAPGILGEALVGLRWPQAGEWAGIAEALSKPPRGAEAAVRAQGPVAAHGTGPPAFVALDTETTGLGGAAGTLAFMIGLAWPEAGGLVIEQWWLQGLGGEAGMLRAVAARLTALLGPQSALLSFNGLSFDLPLLRRRFARHRVDPAALEGRHLDLLPPARRLGRAPGGDARLATLERAHLGVRRVGDVGGAAIPAAFWRWLEAPEDPAACAVISSILAHNAVDLAVLPALAAALARAAAGERGRVGSS